MHRTALAGALGLVAWIGLMAVSRHDSSPPLWLFFLFIGTATLAWLYAAGATGARVRWIVAFSILFRLAGFLGQPLYEDDFYRYLWDGRAFATTGNPYGKPPADSFGVEQPGSFEQILGGINNPDVPTIYGPVCQISFLLAYWISPGDLWPLKLILLAADFGVLGLIWRMTGSARALVVYGWCPLVVKEIAFTGHPDVLAGLFAVLSLYLLQRGHRAGGGFAFALAVASKASVLALVPLLLREGRWKAGGALGIGLAALYLPFIGTGATEFDGLRAFGAGWEFNSFGYAILQWANGEEIARVAWVVCYLVLLVFVMRRFQGAEVWSAALLLFFAFAPVVNPWYLLLLAPFAALTSNRWSLAALGVVVLAYATQGNLGSLGEGQFNHPWWVRWVEAGVVGAAALVDWRRRSRVVI